MIREAIDARLKELTITADEALRRLSEMAMGDLAEFMDDTGYVDISAIRASGKTHLIKEWEQWEHTDDDGEVHQGRVKLKLYDAQSALKEIIRLHQLASGEPTDRLHIQLKWPDNPKLGGDG